jgi:tetrapyrrole methylase family protein / MazG family protein
MAPRKKKLIKARKPRSSRRRSPRPAPPPAVGPAFQKLVAVMNRLRSPGGCPWDREQTHATLRTYLIEEAYEVLDALDAADDVKFAEELGDLLLQVLFHAQIAREERRFSIADVIREIYEKMIRRHPHVFGANRAKDAAEVLRNWEIIKKRERQSKSNSAHDSHESLLDGVPPSLPALLEAFQLTRKAARIGFDWHDVDGIFEKLREETGELQRALAHRELPSRIEAEVGDLLFVAVNLARFLDIDPENAMKKASSKFSRRFREMERIARAQGTSLAQIPRADMEALWDRSKLLEHSLPPPSVNHS